MAAEWCAEQYERQPFDPPHKSGIYSELIACNTFYLLDFLSSLVSPPPPCTIKILDARINGKFMKMLQGLLIPRSNPLKALIRDFFNVALDLNFYYFNYFKFDDIKCEKPQISKTCDGFFDICQ